MGTYEQNKQSYQQRQGTAKERGVYHLGEATSPTGKHMATFIATSEGTIFRSTQGRIHWIGAEHVRIPKHFGILQWNSMLMDSYLIAN